MIPGAQGDGGDYAIAQVTGHVPRNHMEAAPVFDEITGDPLNDPVSESNAATRRAPRAARRAQRSSHRALHATCDTAAVSGSSAATRHTAHAIADSARACASTA
jgi:hypothetical protein